ncbi:queuosine precursor transporter [Thermosipho ferrireducens]|uniref:Probable queuosine precursor transporter n=1 Tax=Thermosipho ferrireducens TaxID=2571116 RepID=A0ABX7S6J0_9BACT|nr:queuosine precursor transporter [Thermosipho ferrireducens]QTA38199.1 queuosine precursor transporter [Thermosipho ferrireducens]
MNKASEKLITLSGLFVSVIVVSNIIAGKLINIGPFVITLSVLIYPLSFALSTIIFEIFGERIAKKVIYTGFLASLILAIVSYITILYPPSPIFENNDAYLTVFNATPRIILASFLAYYFAQIVNLWAFSFSKTVFRTENIYFRNIISMFLTQFVDSLIFVLVSFYGVYEWKEVVNMILSQYIIKLIFSALNSPIISLSVKRLKRDLVLEQ